MRLAPSATSSSSAVDSSASAASSTCTLSIGVPSSPAFHRQRFSDVFKEEGTSRPRSGGASTSSGYNSPCSDLVTLPPFADGCQQRRLRPSAGRVAVVATRRNPVLGCQSVFLRPNVQYATD